MPDSYDIAWGMIISCGLCSLYFTVKPWIQKRLAYRRNVRFAVQWEASRDPDSHVKIHAPQAGTFFDQDAR